ncbi:putative FMRFamide-like neuropeptide [Dirofilaria immitis]
MANAQDDETLGEKRAMRNALIRFGRSGIRNALIRFGKRMSDMYFSDAENRRTVVLHPSVKFDRFEHSKHINNILSKI